MQFHLTIKVHDAIVLDDDQKLRRTLGPQIGRILESGKHLGGGFFGGARGAYLVLEIAEPRDLYKVLGPEVFSTCTVEAHPIIPWDQGAALFQEWGEAGR